MSLQRREGRALASPLSLTVASDGEPRTVDRAWTAILAEFAEVDRAMSRFREDSEITALHRSREAIRVTPRLRAALALADRARRVTEGRFDAGVVTAIERLGSVGVPQAWPGARRSSGRAVAIDSSRQTVRLLAPVDLGGVGKGLALRWAAHRAAAILGGRGFLLEAGGDIVSKRVDARSPWSVAMEDPAGHSLPVATCELEPDGAIATSSVRLATWRDPAGRPVHHLIDPWTGEPGGRGLLAVTVAGPDPAWAEIWSKALFLEGLEGVGLAARARGLAAWWVDESGTLSMTPAARQRTTWVRAEAAREDRAAVVPGLSPLAG